MKKDKVERSEFTLAEYEMKKEMANYLKSLIEGINVSLIELELIKKEIKSDIEYHTKDFKKKIKIKTDSYKKLKEAFEDLIEGSKSSIKKLNQHKKVFLAQKSKWTADKIKCQKRYEEISNALWPVNEF